jgi:hypothetical protein
VISIDKSLLFRTSNKSPVHPQCCNCPRAPPCRSLDSSIKGGDWSNSVPRVVDHLTKFGAGQASSIFLIVRLFYEIGAPWLDCYFALQRAWPLPRSYGMLDSLPASLSQEESRGMSSPKPLDFQTVNNLPLALSLPTKKAKVGRRS